MKTFLLCLLFFSVSVGSRAQQADTTNLDNLTLKDLLNVKITTASKTSQTLQLASAAVIVVTKEQIRARGYQSLLDVMHDLPDVKVDDKMYSGMRNSFTIRGIQGSEKFIILLDGINISSPSGEAMPIMQNYPVHLAEQIEVVYGPGSALYGANAVSGIINIITRKTASHNSIVDVSTSVGDHGYTNTTFFLSNKIEKNASLMVSGQYFYDRSPDYSQLHKDDSLLSMDSYNNGTFNTIYGPFTPVAPFKPAYEAPFEAYNLFASLLSGKFAFNYFRSYSRIPTSLENNTLNAIFNKEVYMAQSISAVNASYKRKFGKITSSTGLTTSFYNMDPRSNYRNLYSGMEPAYKYSASTMIKAEQQLDFSFSEILNVTAGISYEDYNAIPQSADLASPVNPDNFIQGSYLGTAAANRPEGLSAPFYYIRYNNIGSFFQSQYNVGKKLSLTMGARYDRNSRFGSTFNPRLGMVYQLSPGTTVKLLYGSAYRAPAPTDSYAQYGSFDTQDSGRTYHSYFLHLPNPGLKPARSHNTEINIQSQLNDNLHITFDAYYTTLSGLFTYADDNLTSRLYNNMFNGIPVDYVQVFINNDRQRNSGGSIRVDWKTNIGAAQLNSYASVSYVDGVKETGLREQDEKIKDTELDFISPFMLRVGTDMKWNKFGFSPRLIIAGKQRLPGISDTSGARITRQTIPGYALLNLSMNYKVSKQFSVFANISNALNQEYRNVSYNMDLTKTDTELYYGQPQDPIRALVGFHFNF